MSRSYDANGLLGVHETVQVSESLKTGPLPEPTWVLRFLKSEKKKSLNGTEDRKRLQLRARVPNHIFPPDTAVSDGKMSTISAHDGEIPSSPL